MALADRPSLILPRFTCVLATQTSGKKSSIKCSDYEFDTPSAADDVEGLEVLIKKFPHLYAKCPPTFTTPASTSDGDWKWDLSNRLQILTQRKEKANLTPIYIRIGFVPKKKGQLPVTVVEVPKAKA